MNLATILSPDAVLLHVKASSMDSVIEQISARAEEVTGIRAPLIRDALAERLQGGVNMGGGIAIPHARIANLRRIVTFFVRPLAPIPTTQGDVSLIFVLLAPEGANSDHLRALAQIAGKLRAPESRSQLTTEQDAQVVYALLTAA